MYWSPLFLAGGVKNSACSQHALLHVQSPTLNAHFFSFFYVVSSTWPIMATWGMFYMTEFSHYNKIYMLNMRFSSFITASLQYAMLFWLNSCIIACFSADVIVHMCVVKRVVEKLLGIHAVLFQKA